jgi:hypothetical protein
MMVWRAEGDGVQTLKLGCGPRSDCPPSVALLRRVYPSSVTELRRVNGFRLSEGCGPVCGAGVSPAGLGGIPPPCWALLPGGTPCQPAGGTPAPLLFDGPAAFGFSGGKVSRFDRQKVPQRRFWDLFA